MLKLVSILFLSTHLFAGVNIQQFSRSSSIAYEMIEDARVDNSHVTTDFDLMFNLGASFVDQPLTVKNPLNSQQLDSVIDDMLGFHVGASWYIKKYLQISAQSYYANFKDVNGNSYSGFGDIDLRFKLRLYHSEKSALSIMPQMIIPSKQGRLNLVDSSGATWGTHNILSDDGIGYGGRLIYERVFKHFQIALNLGILFNDKAIISTPTATQMDFTKKLQTGIGIYVPIKNSWGLNLEFMRHWSNPIFNDDINPNEVFLGTSFGITKWMVGFAGAGFGNPLSGIDGNDWRAVAGLKITPRGSKSLKEKPVAVYKAKESTPAESICFGNFFDDVNAFTVLFDNNIFVTKPHQNQKIREAAHSIISKIKYVKDIKIHGHTSSVHTSDYNMRLGVKRAEHIRDLLISYGVPAHLFTEVISKGEDSLLQSGTTREVHRLNRRAEVLITLTQEYINECEQ